MICCNGICRRRTSSIRHRPQDPETHTVNQVDDTHICNDSRNQEWLNGDLGDLPRNPGAGTICWSSLLVLGFLPASYQEIVYCPGSNSSIQKAIVVCCSEEMKPKLAGRQYFRVSFENFVECGCTVYWLLPFIIFVLGQVVPQTGPAITKASFQLISIWLG